MFGKGLKTEAATESSGSQWWTPANLWNQAESELIPLPFHSPTSLWCYLPLAEPNQKPEGKRTHESSPSRNLSRLRAGWRKVVILRDKLKTSSKKDKEGTELLHKEVELLQYLTIRKQMNSVSTSCLSFLSETMISLVRKEQD